MNAKNSGFITIVTIGNEKFEIDGYVKHDVMETLLSKRSLLILDWTDNVKSTVLVLSESNFIEDKYGNVFEVEIEEIDNTESRKFDSCLRLSKAIESFMKEVK
jgi:hypothetical protein